jgi:hypothetical protein
VVPLEEQSKDIEEKKDRKGLRGFTAPSLVTQLVLNTQLPLFSVKYK